MPVSQIQVDSTRDQRIDQGFVVMLDRVKDIFSTNRLILDIRGFLELLEFN